MSSLQEDGQPAFPKPGKRKRKKMRVTGPKEETIQKAVQDYLDAHQIRYIHIPDCIYRLCAPYSKIPIWQKKEISDHLKGVPDIVAFIGDKYLLLELKRKNGKLRIPQKAWLKGLTYHVPDTITDAIRIINEFRNESINMEANNEVSL